jgi:hypothetical protein
MTRQMVSRRTLAGIALGIAACATTSMNSLPSPELGGRTFHHILVVAAFADLGIRRETEDRFAAADSEGDFVFVPSYQVFFPGRQYTTEEAGGLLRKYHIDATLVIFPGQGGGTSGYVPPTYTSGCRVWTTTGGCSQVTTTQTGGYSYQKPWAQFTAQLYDATTGAGVWVASATTGGNAYASAITLVHSMADKTIERLMEDGVIH